METKVFINVEGIHYEVAENKEMLIEPTAPWTEKSKALNILNIKGIGQLQFLSRKVVYEKSKCHYFIYFSLIEGEAAS